MSNEELLIDSSFLFAEPTFVDGIGCIARQGIIVNDYNNSKSISEADCRAIRHDWIAIGRDLYSAIMTETTQAEK